MYQIDKLLKRAWQILWNYKVLWIFGLLLALTGAGGGGGGGGSSYSGNYNNRYNNGQYNFSNFEGFTANQNLPQWVKEFGTWVEQSVVPLFATPEKALQTTIWMIVILVGFSIVMGLLFALVRYPSETATMRMVDEYEQTGTKLKFKQGWKLGWNHRAFRVWLVDLLISLPAILFAAIVVGLGILLASNAIHSGGDFSYLPGMAAGIGLLLVFSLVFALFMAALGLLRQFVVRFVALDNLNVGVSFKQGWEMFRHNFKNAFLTWLVLIGIGIAFGFALLFAAILLIPAYAILTIPGALVSAVPGAIGFGITSIFTSGWLPWAIAALVALPVFLMIVFSPISFFNGWFVVYESNIWTLAFRQFKFIASIPPVPAPPVEVLSK